MQVNNFNRHFYPVFKISSICKENNYFVSKY